MPSKVSGTKCSSFGEFASVCWIYISIVKQLEHPSNEGPFVLLVHHNLENNMLHFAVASSWGLGDSTVFIFVLCTKAVSSSPPYAASQSPVSLPLPLLFPLSVFALLGWLFSELGGQRYGLSQKEALFL